MISDFGKRLKCILVGSALGERVKKANSQKNNLRLKDLNVNSCTGEMKDHVFYIHNTNVMNRFSSGIFTIEM